jgi:hypothetical protein
MATANRQRSQQKAISLTTNTATPGKRRRQVETETGLHNKTASTFRTTTRLQIGVKRIGMVWRTTSLKSKPTKKATWCR